VLGVVDVLSRVPAHGSLTRSQLRFRVVGTVIGLGEQVVLDPVGQPAHPDADQPKPAGEVDALEQRLCRGGEDAGAVRRPAQGARAGVRLEVVVAHLERHRPAGQPVLAQPRRHGS
jgi:hypothetical protein